MSTPNLHNSQRRSAHGSGSGKKASTTAESASKLNPSAAGKPALIDADQREAMIRKAAYFRAAYRGFCPGHELEDWLSSETEIDQMLANGELPRLCNY